MKKKINNGIFYVVISLVAVLAIGSVATIAFVGNASRVIENVEVYQEAPQPATPVEDGTLGGGPSGYFNTKVFASEGLIQGGHITNASSTLYIAREITAAEICDSSIITVNSASVAGDVIAASLDLTMAATSSLFAECLRNNGDEVRFNFLNQSPTAATTTELVQGAGCTQTYDVSAGDDVIPGQKGATVEIIRADDWLANGGSSDCIVKIHEWN